MALKKINKNAKLFHDFIRDKKILVVDQGSTSRVAIADAMTDLGAIATNINLVPNFEFAEMEIRRTGYEVVICDYNLGNRSGLELLELQREKSADLKQSLFILVTGNASQSAIAEAAEEDVDAFIIKPFSPLILKQRILEAALEKLQPSAYKEKIEQGKEYLFSNDFEMALAKFQEAVELDPKPTLALFYHGQVNTLIEKLDSAHEDYKQGLSYNRIHYKCLVGMYELMMKQELFHEAYDIVKKIARYFPANPKRLGSVVRLAIMTDNFSDIEQYYQTFINLDQRNPELIRYVCAGLVICGKFYLQKKTTSRALELFAKASVTAHGQPKILKEIIVSLIESDLPDPAQQFLERFPAKYRSSPEYLTSEYIANAHKLSLYKIIEKGRSLINNMVVDPAIYKLMIRKLITAQMNDAAQQYIAEAIKKWPKQATEFQNLSTNAGKRVA